MKKMGLREFLFILPILLLIGIFSLWPVVQSFTYTFFDYQLNDQTKSGLYLNERFNVDVYNETAFYVERFLDRSEITAEEDQETVEQVVEKLNNVTSQFEGKEGVIEIDNELKSDIQESYTVTSEAINTLSEKYELQREQELPSLVKDLDNSLIESNFIGFQGYIKAFKDDRVHTAFINTFVFTIVSVAFELVLGLGMALIMNKGMRGQGFIRTASLIPWALPTAVGALMWSYLYDGGYGIVAKIFADIGLIAEANDLMQTATGAMSAAILADIWKTTPYMAILLLAGLQTIPKSLYEAGSIDGASKFQQFFRITLPLLKPSILVALLFRTLDAFRVFDLIYVLTNGGPGGSTETLSIYSYKAMFGQTNFGYGSVIVMIMFVCVAIIAIIFVRVLGTNLMEKN
ncbi:ABC transporter permease subunit [Pontibacillus yanchengensis]|uniref:ABC transporter permease subunit n=1 Tax=Pontibacillus yanchengensis TaxID=462910 RepID=A0A6I5A270_9BACI|nr:sugar ABC transporter permease [Pontibacillus yanchengensis]MYL34672.1 ABC transporter permease subunit [Pontibacillus yanchengensis]